MFKKLKCILDEYEKTVNKLEGSRALSEYDYQVLNELPLKIAVYIANEMPRQNQIKEVLNFLLSEDCPYELKIMLSEKYGGR